MTGGRAPVCPAARAGSAPSLVPSPNRPPLKSGEPQPWAGGGAHVLTATTKTPRRPPPRPLRLTRAAGRAGAASSDHQAIRPSPASLHQLSNVRCPAAPRVSSPRRWRRAAAASGGTYRLLGQAPLSAPGRERRREASRGAAPASPRRATHPPDWPGSLPQRDPTSPSERHSRSNRRLICISVTAPLIGPGAQGRP